MTYPLAQFTLPPSTRAPGTPNPAPDMDQLILAMNATGAIYNVLNSANGTVTPNNTGVDCTAGINAALAAADVFGFKVYIPSGVYTVTGPILHPPTVAVVGDYADEISTYVDGNFGTTIQPSATWSAGGNPWAGVWVMLGQAAGGYSNPGVEYKLTGIHIDCHLMPGATVADGFLAYGGVARAHLERVLVSYATGNGYNYLNDVSGNGSDAHRLDRCNARNCVGNGVNHVKISDCTYNDCLMETCGGHGWFVQNAHNGKLIACRSEHNGTAGVGDGYHHLQTSASTGSGGLLYVGCSTDRNEANGISIQSNNSTGVPIVVSGCNFRRDGRNGGSGGGNLAGILITAFPGTVILSGCNVFPGVADSGLETNSPQIGLKMAGNTAALTSVMASSCYFQGNSTDVSDDFSESFIPVGCVGATGTTASPSNIRIIPSASALQKVAATPVAGVGLINGTQTFASWTAPNDGQMHRVLIFAIVQVTTAETGGQINAVFTDPGGNAHSFNIIAGSQAAGGHSPTGAPAYPVEAGQVVSVTQNTALTAGAATIWAEIWAA